MTVFDLDLLIWRAALVALDCVIILLLLLLRVCKLPLLLQYRLGAAICINVTMKLC